MKTYNPPGWEPNPIFEEWVAATGERFGLGAITTEQVGLGALVALAGVVALLLSLQWRNASSGQAERDPGLKAREPEGEQRVRVS